jgi:MIP family channel proteins
MKRGMMRRYAAEFFGTLAIVFFGCGSIATIGNGGGMVGHLAINLVFGFTVTAMIYALGHLSAAHFNPAVTLGFAAAGRFPWRYAGPYWVAQFTGAFLASSLHFLFFSDKASSTSYGATIPMATLGSALGVEIVLTFFLMLVIISVATDQRVNDAVAGLAIGLTVASAGLFGGPLSGCSMNPARSLAPALFTGGGALTNLWIYFLGPGLGAVLGAITYEAMRGSEEHAQGAPNDLFIAIERIEQMHLERSP